MTQFFRTKLFAWLAFALVLIMICMTFTLRVQWWQFIDIFFAFMAAFINLVAVTVRRINPIVSKKLDFFSALFCILFILAFIGEWIALNI